MTPDKRLGDLAVPLVLLFAILVLATALPIYTFAIRYSFAAAVIVLASCIFATTLTKPSTTRSSTYLVKRRITFLIVSPLHAFSVSSQLLLAVSNSGTVGYYSHSDISVIMFCAFGAVAIYHFWNSRPKSKYLFQGKAAMIFGSVGCLMSESLLAFILERVYSYSLTSILLPNVLLFVSSTVVSRGYRELIAEWYDNSERLNFAFLETCWYLVTYMGTLNVYASLLSTMSISDLYTINVCVTLILVFGMFCLENSPKRYTEDSSTAVAPSQPAESSTSTSNIPELPNEEGSSTSREMRTVLSPNESEDSIRENQNAPLVDSNLQKGLRSPQMLFVTINMFGIGWVTCGFIFWMIPFVHQYLSIRMGSSDFIGIVSFVIVLSAPIKLLCAFYWVHGYHQPGRLGKFAFSISSIFFFVFAIVVVVGCVDGRIGARAAMVCTIGWCLFSYGHLMAHSMVTIAAGTIVPELAAVATSITLGMFHMGAALSCILIGFVISSDWLLWPAILSFGVLISFIASTFVLLFGERQFCVARKADIFNVLDL